jgi:hypothetical protein
VYNFFPVALQRKSGLGRFIVEVSRSHTIRNTHTQQNCSERVIISSQRPRYLHNTQHTQRWTSMPASGFEPTIPVIQWHQALDSTATRIGKVCNISLQFIYLDASTGANSAFFFPPVADDTHTPVYCATRTNTFLGNIHSLLLISSSFFPQHMALAGSQQHAMVQSDPHNNRWLTVDDYRHKNLSSITRKWAARWAKRSLCDNRVDRKQ